MYAISTATSVLLRAKFPQALKKLLSSLIIKVQKLSVYKNICKQFFCASFCHAVFTNNELGLRMLASLEERCQRARSITGEITLLITQGFTLKPAENGDWLFLGTRLSLCKLPTRKKQGKINFRRQGSFWEYYLNKLYIKAPPIWHKYKIKPLFLKLLFFKCKRNEILTLIETVV